MSDALIRAASPRRDAPTNGHRLVLFDIDGTLLSAGRVARDSILTALETAFGWRATSEHQNREKYDFSGKTDPQIVRELVLDDIGRERFDAGIASALRLYLEELERGLAPGTVVPKPGITALLARLARDPERDARAADRQSRARRAAEAGPSGFQPLLSRSEPSGAIPPTVMSSRGSRWTAPSRTPAAGSRASPS